MGTVLIPDPGGASYPIYGTNTDAIAYHVAGLSAAAVAWSAATATNQNKSLVQATRYLDSQSWRDDLDWIGDHDSVDVPVDFEEACYELAALILANPTLVDAASGGGSNIQAVTGAVGVTFFAPQDATPLPSLVMRLVGQYLGGSTAIQGSYGASEATGTDTCSDFDACDYYRRDGF